MDCEQALTLISAQLDREIAPHDRIAIEAHLQTCPECRATAEAFQLQDVDLRRAFAPRREVAAAVAEQVVGRLGAPTAPLRSTIPLRQRIVFALAGVAALAGF